ncbi:hypothetical protein H5200_06870 [Pseudoalteromonas sp. SG43-7]|uniref:hypothetical protein n=1 Tax=unclassified Pseudoalteromonas TaxID=194690 RepID=UPI001601EED1|nr:MULTISPECIES: hypothetical protein [unclassified Pseudoalteromonas]MBB1295098.1 hypothetical protein [Pseudoalteromonas sp. SR41-4]MBB1421638.1 hypothetical protein [Pseudoalteromonas sp. SG43-7]
MNQISRFKIERLIAEIAMAYKLKLEDLNYYIPRHDEIRPQQTLWLANEVYQNSNVHLVTDITVDREVTLYIDERFIKSMTFVGGVLVDNSFVSAIAGFVKQFKYKFRPELEPEEWLIKGSGNWIHDDQEFKESKMEALTRWILWSKALEKHKLNFDFHSATVLNKKYNFKSRNKRDKNIEKFEVLFDSIFSSLKAYHNAKITVITDNIEGAQKLAFYKSIEKAKLHYEINGQILKKDDYGSFDSCLMQFVDMNIYPMSRFLMPQNNNILMDFENFAIEHVNGTIHNTLKEKGKLYVHYLAAKYNIMSTMFHVLRHSIRKNQYFSRQQEAESSCHLLSNRVHLNFGALVDREIHRFCNNPQNAKFMDLSKL